MIKLILFHLIVISLTQDLQSLCTVRVPHLEILNELNCLNIYTHQTNQISVDSTSQSQQYQIYYLFKNRIISNSANFQHIFVGDLISAQQDENSLENILTFEAPVILQSGIIRTSLVVTPSFTDLLQTHDWKLIHHDDFETDSSLVGWNIPYRSYCNLKQKRIEKAQSQEKDQDSFLIQECAGQIQNITKNFKVNQIHESIKITAEVHIFGDWHGESIQMKVNQKIGWQQTFHFQKDDSIEHPCPNLQALSIPIEIILDEPAEEIQISFISMQKRHKCEGSFAIDDIIIYFK